MRVLITGGNGFIGRYTIEALLDRGHTVRSFDRSWEPGWPYDVERIIGDIRDAEAVSQAVAECDGVMHLAGILGTQETVENPDPAVQTNIVGGLNIFRAIRECGVPAVNIAAANHWMWNPYSITKKAAERFALMANKEWGTRIALVRGMNVYGPRQKATPVRKIMPNLILPALRGEVITIYGDGEQVMDMIYATDVAEVLCRALEMDHGVYDSVMDAGTGRVTTVNDLARMVLEALGKQMVEGKTVRHIKMRPGEPVHSVVLGDPGTLEPLGVGVDDLTTLEDGLKLTIASYS